MWRKNRAPNGHHYRSNSNCIGVDLNRNFGYHWMGKILLLYLSNLIFYKNSENGASKNPCSETFAGTEQDSEPETQSLQRFINQSSRQWDAYLTFHSYGQYWIYPWGFALYMPDDYMELVDKQSFFFLYLFLSIFYRKIKQQLVRKH
jgi:hypothetical protein